MIVYPGFEILECQGTWYTSSESHPQTVLVQLGPDDLVLRTRDEMILTHWSLYFIQEIKAPGTAATTGKSAVFSPDPQSGERLVIDDSLMIGALRGERLTEPSPPAVHQTIHRHSAFGFAWRPSLFLIALLVAAGMYWSTPLITTGASLVGASERQSIGDGVYTALMHGNVRQCTNGAGQKEVNSLLETLVPDRRLAIHILQNIPFHSHSLPGDLVILNAGLLDYHDGPEVIAGYILLESVRLNGEDPLIPFLQQTRMTHLANLLFGWAIPTESYDQYAQNLRHSETAPIPAARLQTAFQQAGFPFTPFAAVYANESTDPNRILRNNDPQADKDYRPLMTDAAWQSLRTICLG